MLAETMQQRVGDWLGVSSTTVVVGAIAVVLALVGSDAARRLRASASVNRIEQRPSQSWSAQAQFCHMCASPIAATDRFCGQCGHRVNTAASQTADRRVGAATERAPAIAVLVLVLLAGAATAWYWFAHRDVERDYPAQVRVNFLMACNAVNDAPDLCACSLEAIEDEFTLEEFVALEAEMTRTGNMPPSLSLAASEC